MREIVNCVTQWGRLPTVLDSVGYCWLTDDEGDCWLCHRKCGRLVTITDHERDCWLWYRPLCQNAGGCWLLTMREITDCGTDHEGDCWLWHRPWGRLLTVAQTMRETDCYCSWGLLILSQEIWDIVDCVTDHEGGGWLTHTEGDYWLCHRPWGKLLSLSQLTLNTAYHLCTLVLTLYNVHIILSKSSMNHRWFWTIFHTKFV